METNIYNIVGLIRDIAFIVCLPLICIFLILTIGKINRLLSSLARNSENMEKITHTITGTFSEGSGFFGTAIKLFSLIGGIPRKKHGKGDN